MSSSIFSGSSRYASDFQSVITRSVSIASLPLHQMQTGKARLDGESSALSSLDTKFGSLQTAITNVSIGTGLASFRTTISDTSIVSASLSTGAMEGTYSIQVVDVGAYTNTMSTAPGVYVSAASVADPAIQNIVSASEFKLKIGGVEKYTITPAGTSLQALADSINSTAGADVTASIVAIGSGSGLSIRTKNTSAAALDLTYTDGDGAQQSIPMGKAASLVTDANTQTLAPASRFSLKIDGVEKYGITPTGTSLSSLVANINDIAGADVHASIVNVGSSSAADYRLSIQMNKLASSTIQLGYTDANGTAQTVLDQLALGSQAQYQVNGSSITSTSDSRTVTLAPGLSVQLLKETGTGSPTTITVGHDTTAIGNGLSALATAYNAASDEIGLHYGTQNGALGGQSIIRSLSGTLRGITSYATGNSGLSSLTALGLTFDRNGKLSFDSTTFAKVTGGSFSDLLTFLGGSTTGGFLKAATDQINGVEDATSGTLKTSITSVTDEITSQTNRISDEQARIDDLTTSLNARMAAADAAIASLEQQVNYITSLFSAMDTASNSMR